jgi:hypothetical protein
MQPPGVAVLWEIKRGSRTCRLGFALAVPDGPLERMAATRAAGLAV